MRRSSITRRATVSNNKAMIALATDSGLAVARKRENGRLVRLVKDLSP
jgi:hypothetical protein